MNKFKPAKKCDGKCYLQKKLKENDHQEKRLPIKKNLSNKSSYLMPSTEFLFKLSETNKKTQSIQYHKSKWKDTEWYYSLLRPPIFA